MKLCIPPADATAAIRLADELEREFGFVTVGMVKGTAENEPGSTITRLWRFDTDPHGYSILARGSLADWKRQGDYLFKRFSRAVTDPHSYPKAGFLRLVRIKVASSENVR